MNLENRVITNSVGPCGTCGHELDRSDERCPFCGAVNPMGPGRPSAVNTTHLYPQDVVEVEAPLDPGAVKLPEVADPNIPTS